MAAAKKAGDKTSSTESRTRYNVTAEEFVEAWQTSETLDEVSRKLKMPKDIISARAGKYRHEGILLKRMKRGRQDAKLDIDKLNDLIRSLGQGKARPKK